MNNKCEPGTCREKEVKVCERCVVYLQTHCVHLSYETVSPLPGTCSVRCSGHPSELQSGPRIAEPQQQTWRQGDCSILVPQPLCKAGPGTDTALQSRWGMVQVMEPHRNSEGCLPAGSQWMTRDLQRHCKSV